ncbi:MAG: NRDE family protein [Kofleriaceae bacterium]
MCTIAILIDIVDGAPLVVAANRDELYARPTRPPELLSVEPRIAGGVDELSGGTWLALRADGQFAAVTNQRVGGPPPPGLRSRGLAVRELAAAADPDAYVAAIDPTAYASMNLVWGAPGRVRIAYARRETGTLDIEPLDRGIHVLCNDRLRAPGFPRCARVASAVSAARVASVGALTEDLARLLADHQTFDPPPPVPGMPEIPTELARALTATCIHSPLYGTRSSTIFAAVPGRVVSYLHADGPPCTTPFVDRLALLEAA